MKKVYFAPETTRSSVVVESNFMDLHSVGNDNWQQPSVGEGDDDYADDDDEGRAKPSVWE